MRKITIVLLAAAIVFRSYSSAAFSDEEAEECFRAIARDSGGSAGDSSGYDRFFLNAFSHLGLAEGWTEESGICADMRGSVEGDPQRSVRFHGARLKEPGPTT